MKGKMKEDQQPQNSASAIQSYNFKDVEEGVLAFWKKKNTYHKIKKKNSKRPKFYFIQGPPYTSGRLHMGHAWNNSLKDMVLRYKRMKHFDVFDRAAYDMHGLPTEHKVQELYKIPTKEDIVKFGVERFIRECEKWSTEKAAIMSDDLWRLGVWMDFENPCFPITNEFMESEWWLIKQAHKKGRLYEGKKTISWCASCQTALAKHECEYQNVVDNSIFVKFKVKHKKNEYLVIWTTTPWTITFNLAIMVNPELEYVRAKVGDEIWIVAKALAGPLISAVANKEYSIVDEVKGSELEGLEYEHPWHKEVRHYAELKAKHPKVHTVVLSEEYVTLSAGSGLVHCAPGCGPEDYEVGHRNKIPPFNTIGEDGMFPDEMGPFAGVVAKKDDKKFVDALAEKGVLIASTKVEHDYAHCWRCKNPVVFRTTPQWFFKVEDLKVEMMQSNEEIHWVPLAGKHGFRAWLDNLRDNSITKQRFWGTPLPIWRCDTCQKYDVVGSADELASKAGRAPENLHKPWIDGVEYSCECGGLRRRIPDVLDVWIDAGTLSWSILDYPKRRDLFEKLFPADFITEAKEQIRGWFNLLMVASYLAFGKPCFKAVYMHGMLTDVEGEKMSKSLGNVISPYELIDKHGADTLRLYMLETTAGEDIRFSWDEAKLRHRNLGVLWNVHKYLIDYYRQNRFALDDERKGAVLLDLEEGYMRSKTASTLKEVSALFENYQLDLIPPKITELFLELSRTYIQLTRDKTLSEDAGEKEAVFWTMYDSLLVSLKLLSPVAPFITEAIYQNMREEFSLKTESIHQFEWPEVDEPAIDAELERKFDVAKNIIQSVLFAREKAKLSVRWPVKEVVIASKDAQLRKAVLDLSDLIKTQTNVKEFVLLEEFEKVKQTVKADYGKIGPAFGEDSPKVITQIALHSTESILGRIEKEGKFPLVCDGKVFELGREHLIIKHEVPEMYVEAEFKGGFIYLDKTRSHELDAEGYAREIMRRVQALRKEAGLQKADRIDLIVRTDGELKGMLASWSRPIQEKVGAVSIKITDEDTGIVYQTFKQERFKDKDVMIMFQKQPAK
ncbi:isoleucine--tRNA ligase [Candidatus Woesearchaeota archaeon]|nr:isoleucine--tRNA ligase [Candidatus Woesearchaeota archaeon]